MGTSQNNRYVKILTPHTHDINKAVNAYYMQYLFVLYNANLVPPDINTGMVQLRTTVHIDKHVQFEQPL